MEYLNHLLLQYPDESRQTASDIVGGFQEAIADMEDISMDDMDEAYNTLYQNLMTMPTFQDIQSRLAAITLAKFFLNEFQYLPSPSIHVIQSSEVTTDSNQNPHRTASTLDSNNDLQISTHVSLAPGIIARVRNQSSPATSNHIESSGYISVPSDPSPPRVSPNNGKIHNHAAHLAAVAMHNQHEMALRIPSLKSLLVLMNPYIRLPRLKLSNSFKHQTIKRTTRERSTKLRRNLAKSYTTQ